MIIPSASYPILPRGTVIRQPNAHLKSEPTGLATITEKYRGYFNDVVTNNTLAMSGTNISISRSYRSPHPDFPSLLAYGVDIMRGTGVINGTLAVEYRGLDPALAYPPPPIYTIEAITGNEPLQTHPLWTTQIAGTADTSNGGTGPLNGAQFVSATADGTGTGGTVVAYNPGVLYPGTGPDPGFTASVATFYQWVGKSIFTGIEDYLVLGVVYKKRYSSLGLPNDISDGGQFSDPDGPVPDLPDGYDWFFLGETADDNAGIFLNTATWKAVPNGPAAQIIYGGS